MVNTGKAEDGVADLIHLPLGLLALNYMATCVCSNTNVYAEYAYGKAPYW